MSPSQPTNQNLEAVFGCSLLDPSGRPNLVIDSAGEDRLIWKLVNNATGAGQNLVVTPFDSGPASPSQYHFAFTFSPGALTAAPTVEGWEVAVEADGQGGLRTVYLALGGTTPLSIAPGGSNSVTWTYTKAIQENPGSSAVSVTATAGANVALAGTPIRGKSFGPFDLTLVPAGTPALSAPPISVDFVGRRTVLNDGQTQNSFTFALTNLTSQSIPVTPKPEGRSEVGAAPTVFTVWFDAAPNDPQQPYPWALAQIQQLDAKTVALSPPSADWDVAKQVSALEAPQVVTGNPQWALTANKPVSLPPQSPLIFTFSGIVTDLDPGVARMYLHYQNLPGFADGILVAGLEKSPVLYGTTRGQGLYLSAGTYAGDTPPAPDYGGGLYVDQFDALPAATLSGGTGLVIQDTRGPAAHVQGETTLDGPLQVNGSATVTGPLSASGSATVGADLSSASLTTGPLTVNGLSKLQGVEVTGALEVGEKTTISDRGWALDNVSVTGAVNMRGTLGLTGNLTLNGVLIGNSWIGGQAARVRGYGTASEAVFAFKFDNRNYGNTPNAIQVWNESAGVYKTFIIEHPLDEERYLVHATLEGPEAAVFYRGSGRLRGGRAEITLPAYFTALTDPESVTVQLTGVDGSDRLYVRTVEGRRVHDGRVSVASDDPASTQAFDWEVKAARKDQPPFLVEPEKRDLAVQGFGPYVYATPGPEPAA